MYIIDKEIIYIIYNEIIYFYYYKINKYINNKYYKKKWQYILIKKLKKNIDKYIFF